MKKLFLLLVIFSYCSTEKKEQPYFSPDTWGGYDVGVTTYYFHDDSRNRNLTTEVWFPAKITDNARKEVYYGLIEGNAYRYAEKSNSAAPYPLIVFSHGNQGVRVQSIFYTEYLASHGYVVAAPDHQYNTLWDYDESQMGMSAFDRPKDVSFIIDMVFELSASGDEFLSGMIDTKRVGVTGHSYGGYTALASAGGKLGGDIDLSDSRISASVPLAPGIFAFFGEDGIANITIPTMIIGGSADITVPFDEEDLPIFNALNSPAYLIEIMGAGHFSFTDICGLDFLYDVVGNVIDDGCGPDNIPYEEVHKVTNIFATAFFGKYLKGDARYEEYLSRDYATGFPVKWMQK